MLVHTFRRWRFFVLKLFLGLEILQQLFDVAAALNNLAHRDGLRYRDYRRVFGTPRAGGVLGISPCKLLHFQRLTVLRFSLYLLR